MKDFDASVSQLIKTFDSTLDPVWQRLPEPTQAVVQQAKEARDQVRTRITTLPPDQAEPLAPGSRARPGAWLREGSSAASP